MAVKVLTPEVERYLPQLSWSGNVRQLENTCRWLTVMSPGNLVQMEDLPAELLSSDTDATKVEGGWQQPFRQWVAGKALTGEEGALADVIPQVEKLLMEIALEKTVGKRQEAARLLGWGRNTLTRKLKDKTTES